MFLSLGHLLATQKKRQKDVAPNKSTISTFIGYGGTIADNRRLDPYGGGAALGSTVFSRWVFASPVVILQEKSRSNIVFCE